MPPDYYENYFQKNENEDEKFTELYDVWDNTQKDPGKDIWTQIRFQLLFNESLGIKKYLIIHNLLRFIFLLVNCIENIFSLILNYYINKENHIFLIFFSKK